MAEDDIARYLNNKPAARPLPLPMVRPGAAPRRAAPKPPQQPEGYDKFEASHLFCPTCQAPMPVRERLLLFLPDGELFEYRCTECQTQLGTRKAGR